MLGIIDYKVILNITTFKFLLYHSNTTQMKSYLYPFAQKIFIIPNFKNYIYIFRRKNTFLPFQSRNHFENILKTSRGIFYLIDLFSIKNNHTYHEPKGIFIGTINILYLQKCNLHY